MYLCDKVDQLEHSYPLIAQPTDQVSNQHHQHLTTTINNNTDIFERGVTHSLLNLCSVFIPFIDFFQLTATAISQAKDIYDRTVKSPIDTIDKKVTDIKNYGSNKVNASK